MLAWIIDSLNIIKEKNDAPLLGGFAGAVMELLGRILLFQDGEGDRDNKKRFCEFIEKYLKDCNSKYSIYKETLWKFMRCDGSHAVLAQYGVVFGGEENDKEKHLTIRSDFKDSNGDLVQNKRALFLSTPKFSEDLIWSVKKFAYNLNQDTSLQCKAKKVMDRLENEGQQYIDKYFPKDDKV
ncbi:MAG: hypothetical protein Q7K54_04290 [Candidatus Parcubacteria bacterium]|nr:hypothetical protein [Candidatus Parcubacteria bacterium]